MLFSDLALRISSALYSTAASVPVNGRDAAVHATIGGVRYVDVVVNEGPLVRFIQQNPNKHTYNGPLSWPAMLARRGHKITWIVKVRHDGKFEYAGSGVVDGVFVKDVNSTLRTLS